MGFQLRTFPDFMERMGARVVSRSRLTDLEPGGVLHTFLAAVAREEDATHFELLNLQRVWDIQTAQGEDLDRRAADVSPHDLPARYGASPATGSGVFGRGSGAEEAVDAEDTGEVTDGLSTGYSFGLSPNGLVAGSVSIEWTSAGLNMVVTDDGLGALTGDGAGTVDYATGAVVLDATGATPDVATSITASYTPRAAAITIAAGTIVTQKTSGQTYATSGAVTLAAGALATAPVAIVAVEPGPDGNTDAETIRAFAAVAGIESFVNDSACTGGQAEETDSQFRARIVAFLRSLPRGTPLALKYAALSVYLSGYGPIVAAEVVEGQGSERGKVRVYVDNGSGTIAEYDDNTGDPETVVTASGGERFVFLEHRPVSYQGSVTATIEWTPVATGIPVTLVLDADYVINYATGQITLISGGPAGIPVAGLTAGDVLTAEYEWFTGLIAEAQRTIDGDESAPVDYPGYRAAGTYVLVAPPVVYQQLLRAVVTVLDGYDPVDVQTRARAALIRYVNGLGINGDVVLAELIRQVKATTGVYDVQFVAPLGNVTIGAGELARVKPENILFAGA